MSTHNIEPPDMAPGWAERIAEAQLDRHMVINGHSYPRRPYGPDHWSRAVKPRCRDCGVAIGQLHVPGCGIERCAICGCQAIACDCADSAD